MVAAVLVLAEPPRQRVDRVLAADDAVLLDLLTAGTGPRGYVTPHLDRYRATLRVVPPASSSCTRLLAIGSWNPEIRLLHQAWGYEVAACGMAAAAVQRIDVPGTPDLPAFSYELRAADVETDEMPWPSESFDVVTCWEVLEHLRCDPMHMMGEINRVLRTGGLLVLTTPNIVCARAFRAILRGQQPMFAPSYKRNRDTTARHNREYAASEVRRLLTDAGFSSDQVVTIDVWERPQFGPRGRLVWPLLRRRRGDWGDNVIAAAEKTGPPRERYPGWLYDQ